MIVDPVVVIPDMLSKKASTNDNLSPDNKKGRDPKIAIAIHENVVNKKACCKLSFLFSSKLVSTKSIPIKIVTVDEDKKVLFFSSYKNWAKNGISIAVPKIIRSMPIAKKTVLLLFIFEAGGYLKIAEIQHNKNLLYVYFTHEI